MVSVSPLVVRIALTISNRNIVRSVSGGKRRTFRFGKISPAIAKQNRYVVALLVGCHNVRFPVAVEIVDQ